MEIFLNITRIKSFASFFCVVVLMLFNQTAIADTSDVKNDSQIKAEVFSNGIKNTLFDFSGKAVVFEDYIKSPQWTVVMFWASDCHVCNVEVNQYVKLHSNNQKNNIRVLGVSLDGKLKKTQAEEFISIHNVNFPNLIAEPETVAALYNHYTNESFIGTPTFLVFSPEGKLMAQRPGVLPPELIVNFVNNQSK